MEVFYPPGGSTRASYKNKLSSAPASKIDTADKLESKIGALEVAFEIFVRGRSSTYAIGKILTALQGLPEEVQVSRQDCQELD